MKNQMKRQTLFLLLFVFGCVSAAFVSRPMAVDHGIWDRLLKKYVNEKGLVNYKGLKKEEGELKKYLDLLSKNPPTAKWSKNEQMAYWINAYNAYTVQLVLTHYPIKSIKDIGSKIQIPFVNTPWDIKFITIGNEKYDLNNIEHDILRKKFDEPRIHFALVCAARSCPRLLQEAYDADRLISQLDEQGTDFLNTPSKNAVTPKYASLSKYFDWYKADWTDHGKTVESWINQYAANKINKDTKISYLEYNWDLNGQ